MGQVVFYNARIFFAGADLSTDLNSVQVALSRTMLNATVFGDQFVRNRAGLGNADVSIDGFWNAGTNPDKAYPSVFNAMGTDDQILTVFPNGIIEGSTTQVGMGCLTTVNTFDPIKGSHGQMLGFSGKFSSRGNPAVEAMALKDSTGSFYTSSDVGNKYNLGAVSSTQYLYAGMHVIGYQGTSPTLDMLIQSDTDASAGGETTRITFSQVAGATAGRYATRVAGPITDTYWRANWTIGGSSSPGYKFLVWMAIL